MPIAKKPTLVKRSISKEAKADKFAAAATSQHNGPTQELEFERVTLRFEKHLLNRIDAAAKADAAAKTAAAGLHVPVNRNAFICAVMLECVKAFEEN